MNRDEVREIVRECLEQAPIMCEDEVQALVRETVRETLTTLGVDQEEPLAVQQDMAWLRSTRVASAAMRARAGAALLGVLVTAGATACWLGLRALLGRQEP